MTASTVPAEVVATLHDFLSQRIDFSQEDVNAVDLRTLSLADYLYSFFHLFGEDTLRAIVAEALRHRDDSVQPSSSSSAAPLGMWADVIDEMKTVLQARRDLSAKNFQQVVQYGLRGQLAQVDKFLQLLYTQGYIDHLFTGLLQETKEALHAQLPQSEEQYYMLVCFAESIDSLKSQQNNKTRACSPVLRKHRMAHKLEYEQQSTGTASATSSAVETVTQALQETQLVSAAAQTSAESPPVGLQAASEEYVKELFVAGDLLNASIRECAGDVPRLQRQLYDSLFVQKRVSVSAFLHALRDNIDACVAASYTNKLKLLQFVEKYVLDQQREFEAAEARVTSSSSGVEEGTSFMSTHHAPQFVDENSHRSTGAPRLLNVQSFLDAEKTGILAKPRNNKNKAEKKALLQRASSLAEQMASHVDAHGWAVVDKFIPLDVVRRLRIEFDLFREHFEQAEIWIGKKADVGAHLRVPSVRGDKVLWMCGGHQVLDSHANESEDVAGRKGSRTAPEGVTRIVKTHGEIEPCKLEVKAAAPMRKFAALKEVITACDRIVEQLKGHHYKLGGIYERSDAMLAVYPGEGARFANHIDNTTHDGRRLTMLVYLNPDWTASDGGALRITEVVAPTAGENKSTGDNSIERVAVDVLPLAGRLACFLSSEVPHEVMPTYGDRFSLTIWYYDREERKEAIAKARESGTSSHIAKTSEASQIEAKEFIAKLMGGDEVPEDGGEPTQEELQALAATVEQLSDEVLDIVGNITGAPSVQSFRQGFPMLTLQDLKAMRGLFRRMGLQE